MHTQERRVALVTGASRGIGRAIARRLARDGLAVTVNYREDADAARAVVTDIERMGGTAIAMQADVGVPADIDRLFADTIAHFGGIDVLVANAGHSVFAPLAEQTDTDYERMFAVNTRGTFLCLRAALRSMRDGGRIVCISTIGTVLGIAGGGAYFASKAAVEQLARVAAREAAPRGITVNLVSPGFIDTDMLRGTLGSADAEAELAALAPLARLGTPEDVADAVAFLASSDARWITRQNVAVDGGVIGR